MTTILGILTTSVLVTWVIRHFLLSWTLKHDPVLSTTTFKETAKNGPRVAIIVPACNEEHNIGECLESLSAQDYANLEIIVVDDRSEDRTAEIVEGFVQRDARFRLVRNTELPAGWTGKNHALEVGAEAARNAELLLFVDADTRHAPTNVSQAVTYVVTHNVDMLSLIMPIVNVTFWEKVVQPMTGSMLCIRYPVWKVNDPKSSIAFGNGQYILIRREAYEAVGGHEAVRDKLLEDIAIAKRVKKSGRKLCLAYTGDISRIRMYRSLAEIRRGWSRIFLSGLNPSRATIDHPDPWERTRSLGMMLVGVLMLLVFSLLPYFLFIGTATWLLAGTPTAGLWTLLGLSAATLAVEISVMARFFRAFRTDARYVAFHLLGCLVALSILLSAIALLYSRKGLTWKGTRYNTIPPR